MSHRRSLLIPLGILASVIIAAVSYFWATGAMDSLYAYRSPLAKQPPSAGAPLGNPITRRVVFVLVDGLRTDTADDAATMPFLAELRARGASATMHSHAPSFSAPSYTVLFTGAWPDISDGPALNLAYDQYWTWTQDNLFSAVQRIGGRTAVSGYNWFEKLIPQDAVTDHFYTAGEDAIADRQVVDAALPWLKNGQEQLVLIHLDQVDYAGHHEGGPRNANWSAAARRTDDLLREIVAPLDLAQDTLLVTSDHGHINAGGHGGQDPIVLLEPLVLAGAGVRPGAYEDQQQVDIAATLAVMLGTSIPAASEGRALTQMLTLPQGRIDAVHQAVSDQQARLASVYAYSIGRPPAVESGSPPLSLDTMTSARNARSAGERIPRTAVVLVLLAVIGLIVARSRGQDLVWALAGVLAYLIFFNVRYALLSGRTYSLSSVAGANELIMYVAINTLLAFVIGWLVLVAGTQLFLRPRADAARLTLGWALLTLAIAGLPALFSFAWNGPLITWTMPDFTSFFLGFLGTLQGLFIAVFGVLFSGVAALVARVRRPVMRLA